jgi:hypothetical protein
MQSTRLLFADSKNRDVTLYPSGNSYVLHLTTPIKDIERVDLVSARVPNTVFNCTNGSNVISINSSNVSINPGCYSVYGLAHALTTTTLTLEYLQDEGHFIFSSSTPFTLVVHSQELATMIGISKGSHTSALAGPTDPAYATKYILRSSTLVDLSLNEYIFLDIDELRTPSHVDTGSITGSKGTITGSNANRNFAPVMMDVGSACVKNFHENKDYQVSVSYPEPIASLQRLTVRWVDKTGAPLNFRGWETNAFVLRLHIRDREREEEEEDLKDNSRRLGDLEIKRMLDEQAKPPPPPPPPKKTPFGKWTILVLLLLIALGYWGYKTFLRPNPVAEFV